MYNLHIANSAVELNTTHKAYCSLSIAKIVTRTHHSVTFIAYLVSESIMTWLTLESLIPVGWKRRTNPVQFGILEIHCAH